MLVARPVTATILGRPMDACPPDARDDAYVDLQRIDGAQLALFLWPGEVTATDGSPDYALPGYDKAQRNRLAYATFDNEKLFGEDDMHPWDAWGVPLATIGFNPDWSLAFVDRFSVVRTGGTPGNRTPLVPMTGDPRLWQARIDQFVGQLVEQPSFDEVLLRDTFVRLPPVGLLPRDLFDPVLRRQTFFPGSFALSAIPVPQSNLDLAIREAAALASYNRSAPDRVELLVPVPDTVYEPRLLEIEVADPRFATTMAAFATDRARWLATREIGRRRLDRLNEAISGQPVRWPAADLPIGEDSPDPGDQPPVECTRTRRFDETGATVRLHTMSGGAASLPVAKSDIVWVWVRIHSAANLTGLSLRLGEATSPGFLANFSKGVFWGAAEGFLGELFKGGALPPVGRWTRLEIPASQAWDASGGGLESFAVNGVEFGQRGGQVEWGPFGTTDASGNLATFIADDAPAGAALFSGTAGQTNPSAGWPWKAVPGREDIVVGDFGTIEANGVREVAALDPFRDQWKQDFLKQDFAQLEELGLDAFLGQIRARLDATNDAIDLGFIRARSDIYRVRQYMLGADSASRLVTSPTLADLSARDESARDECGHRQFSRSHQGVRAGHADALGARLGDRIACRCETRRSEQPIVCGVVCAAVHDAQHRIAPADAGSGQGDSRDARADLDRCRGRPARLVGLGFSLGDGVFDTAFDATDQYSDVPRAHDHRPADEHRPCQYRADQQSLRTRRHPRLAAGGGAGRAHAQRRRADQAVGFGDGARLCDREQGGGDRDTGLAHRDCRQFAPARHRARRPADAGLSDGGEQRR
ncbi:hypothetical protein PIB19_12670 [Sphingomonas sp. 7/4-4]|uniref:hypothetical protein n=1 Tax=Sphingomonas sp. 7/4-4 TaxID=3018446 RepID=UPI0022F3DEC4|nr:hypothetical protein [Sphingomonas sp. 7/4-4]WBY06450.1 hypothetical protein PIB19_12670 [Sphingomonas sp. 7/4-4]